MTKPLGKTPAEGYVKQKQQEAREHNKASVDVDVVIDERQAQKAIDGAMKRIVKKLNS